MGKTAVQKSWRHKSVRALMKKSGDVDPEVIIRQEAQRIVMWAKQRGWYGPPFDPLQLASLRGIKAKATQHLFSAEAQLTPLPGRQLLLEFNPDRAEGRRNFSICHEVAHTLFDDCYEIVHQRRAAPKRTGPEDEVEYLCQVGAAEFLMPAEDFAGDLLKRAFSLRSVLSLVDRYRASREAVLRRMVGLAKQPCAVVFLSERLSPLEKAASRQKSLLDDAPCPKMRILYGVANSSFETYLPIHKSVPPESCVCVANDVDAVVSQRERWDVKGFGCWLVEAMALPVPMDAGEDVPSVAALVLP